MAEAASPKPRHRSCSPRWHLNTRISQHSATRPPVAPRALSPSGRTFDLEIFTCIAGQFGLPGHLTAWKSLIAYLFAIFTDDVEVHSPRVQVRGIDKVVDFMRQAEVEGEHTQHTTTDLLVNVSGDQAAVSANSLVYFYRDGQPPHQTSGMRLVCTAVRTPAGWRLRETRIMFAWMRKD